MSAVNSRLTMRSSASGASGVSFDAALDEEEDEEAGAAPGGGARRNACDDAAAGEAVVVSPVVWPDAVRFGVTPLRR